VLSREPNIVKDLIYNSSFREKLQYAVDTPQDFIRLKKENPVFYKEVSGGIILHESKE